MPKVGIVMGSDSDLKSNEQSCSDVGRIRD